MSADYGPALSMLVPDAIVFANSGGYTRKWLCLHRTAGGTTAQGIAQYFQSGSGGRNVSAHYVCGLDGTVVQCVRERDGSGANCCLEPGHDPFWPTDINLNLVTFSIESVDPTTDNSTVMPQAQKDALFALVKDICTRHHIPMRPADASGGIAGHSSIAPQSRARCPGLNFPWDELFAYLSKENPTMTNTDALKAAGWKYDSQVKQWTAPNGFIVQMGFADEVSKSWNPQDLPLENEQSVSQLELSNPSLGGGSRQRFRMTTLEWTPARGVFRAWTGPELIELEKRLQACEKQQPAPSQQNTAASAAIAQIKSIVAPFS